MSGHKGTAPLESLETANAEQREPFVAGRWNAQGKNEERKVEKGKTPPKKEKKGKGRTLTGVTAFPLPKLRFSARSPTLGGPTKGHH